MVTRRKWLAGVAALSSCSALTGIKSARLAAETPAPAAPATAPRVKSVAFNIAERQIALPCFAGKALPLWTFADGPDYPVVRMTLGDTLDASIKNSLPRDGEHVTIHWHGLRIPNAEDGVPYLTQEPIYPAAEGHYRFTPPETGTFFFHTHCNSVEHFGRGLVGALIVEGDEATPSDADLVLIMKDWRLAPDGAFLPFTTDEGAAKAGSYGTVRSINGVTKPVFKVAAAANVRVRLLNVDPARISEVGIEGAEAAIIAIDGNACKPVPLESWRFGPAGRVDILMRTPKAGRTAKLIDYFAPEPVVLAEFVAQGAGKRQGKFKAPALRAGHVKAADLVAAERLEFTFSATATGQSIAELSGAGGLEIGTLCLSKRSFWAINKQSWASVDHKDLGAPLAALKRGQSYVFELKNVTPHTHPIHIHGHTFEVLKSSLRKRPVYRADTVLIAPNERLEVAILADNLGKWMLHCHILEHQETGMMGYYTVT